MSKINNPFVEKEPSLFIVETPFQAMCAINAIFQLKLRDYTLTLHLHRSTKKRNKQTIDIVESYNLKYTIVDSDKFGYIECILSLVKSTGKYSRVFLGTHLYQIGYFHAMKNLKNGGNIVLLDDGVATIALLNDKFSYKGGGYIIMSLFGIIARLRGIRFHNIFTVYKGLENKKWLIENNKISLLRQDENTGVSKTIYIIGTNNSSFILNDGVNEKEFREGLFRVMEQIKLKYPDDDIIYIPHGRDRSVFAKEICDILGLTYKPLDVNVEIYILSKRKIPKVIMGFTSSALYNLKMLYPETLVVNLVMKILSDKCPALNEVSNYYSEHGICNKYF